MIKDARKRSLDPAQEKLRSHKDQWNSSVSEFISNLIAFKKGLNGRGDPALGIPPSSIKEPLPPAIHDRLQELSAIYTSITNNAASIEKEQEHYSKTRRKSKSKVMQPMSADDGLTSEASWWGSRAWAKLPWIGSLKDENAVNRKLRLNLIKFCTSSIKLSKQLEEYLLSPDLDSVLNAVTTLAGFGPEYSILFVKPFKQFLENKKLTQEKKSEPDTDEIVQPDTKEEDESDSEVQSIRPTTKIPISEDYWLKFISVQKDLENVNAVLSFLADSDKLSKDDKLLLSKEFKKLRSSVTQFDFASRKPGAQNLVKMEEMAKDIFSNYQIIKSYVEPVLGSAESFKDYLSKLPKLDLNNVIAYFEEQKEIEKVAANAINKWFQKLRLSFNSDNEDLIKLHIIDELKVWRGKIDNLLDVLEDGKATNDKLASAISNYNKSLLEIISLLSALGDRYNSHLITFKHKNKKVPVKEIPLKELSKISNLEKLLLNFIDFTIVEQDHEKEK